MLRHLLCVLLIFCSSNSLRSSEGGLRLAVPFTSNMVLQRDCAVPVWGFGKPGTEITVRFAGQAKSTTVNDDGDWMLKLDALEASADERSFEVSSNQNESTTLTGVLVGEVWFSSGQSNMVWTANNSMCRSLAAELAASKDDIPIREISIDTLSAIYPQKHAVSTDGWKTHKQAAGFSALSLSFAYDLYKELNVPIGILLSAHSNTRIEAFTQRDSIQRHAALTDDWKLVKDADPRSRQGVQAFEDYYRDLNAWQRAAEQAVEVDTKLPARPNLPGIAGMWRGPSQFFNGKINPVIPFAVRGAIWCQGTSNSGDGRIYAARMEALVAGWRDAWNMPDMPFYFTQMQCYGTPDPNTVGFADIRQAQHLFFMNNRDNVGMVVQTDLNSARPQGIHYFNKLHPGMRLARWALAKTYGKDIPYTGPIFTGYEIKGQDVVVSFENESLFGGLMVGSKGMAKDYQTDGAYVEPARATPDVSLNHFRVCGTDKVWHPATATIAGDNVVVRSGAVQEPVGVQYAYSGTPENSNLYNKAGLPATPFAAIDGELIFEEDDLEKVAALKARYARFTDPDYPILQVVEYFRDGAIIQRDKPIPIWGHANEGVKVTVKLGSVTKTAIANDYQQWALEFPPLAASTTPLTLEVKSSHGFERTVRDILVGDVWYLTGSTLLTSEMAFSSRNQDIEPPSPMPLVREFRRKTAASSFKTPRKRRFETGGGRYRSSWQTANFNDGNEGVSMFAYQFAKALSRKGIPQGFITMSSGQSRQIASPLSWTSYEGVKNVSDMAFQSRLDQLFMQYPNTEIAKQALNNHIKEVKEYVSSVIEKSGSGLDMSDGVPPAVPAFPEAGQNDLVKPDEIPTYAYNWCVSPMTPMAVAGVIWIPSASNIGYQPEFYTAELEIYRKSLATTYGLPDVQFLFAHPSATVVDGVEQPGDLNGKYVTFDQWPKSLASLAAELARIAK